jgi:hypothetical protein
MNIKEKFLQLTEYTTPFGHEKELRHLLPSYLKTDAWGNYYYRVGNNSTTLFTCHLDNYCEKKEKVNHIIEGNLIKTDGTTILGADNKAGVCVLLYLIEKNVPGLYYLFLGEEPIGQGGLWGSSQIFNDLSILMGIERAVAFDRKAYGSVITRQMAQYCCSNEFADALCSDFSSKGLSMKKDETGYYTDTGNLIEVIPECTNISIGVFNEHHNTECVDIAYVEMVAKVASTIDWESLPTSRHPKWEIDEPEEKVVKKYKGFKTSKKDKNIFAKICDELEEKNYMLMNRTDFASGKEMVFNDWFSSKQVKVVVTNGEIIVNGKKVV